VSPQITPRHETLYPSEKLRILSRIPSQTIRMRFPKHHSSIFALYHLDCSKEICGFSLSVHHLSRLSRLIVCISRSHITNLASTICKCNTGQRTAERKVKSRRNCQPTFYHLWSRSNRHTSSSSESCAELTSRRQR